MSPKPGPLSDPPNSTGDTASSEVKVRFTPLADPTAGDYSLRARLPMGNTPRSAVNLFLGQENVLVASRMVQPAATPATIYPFTLTRNEIDSITDHQNLSL